MEASNDTFNSTCLLLLQNTLGINMWYDPIDPMISISENEICELHSLLFTQLKSRGISSLSEFVSFSYLITLDLYFTANQQESYENCVNIYAYNSTSTYAASELSSELFCLLNSTYKSTLSSLASTTLDSSCGDGYSSCDACAITLAVLYQTYQKYVNDLFSYTYQEYIKKIFYSLDTQNRIYATSSSSSSK